ncbi:MAG: ABC transporter substrate-binding protein, partial [Chloroflexota bacterium]
VHPVEKIVVLKRSAEHQQTEEKWLTFTKPRIAEVKVSGPNQVKTGNKAEFQIEVSFEGKPYPRADVDFVRFLVFGARGNLALNGDAQAVRDGLWHVSLTQEQTKQLEVGSNRLEVVVAPKVVSIPSFRSFTFTTLP